MSAQKATPIPRVFVSSTYSDMERYRDAMRSAVQRADCMPVGMEFFGAASVPPLEKCKEELKTCQIYVCAIGMRYGSIEEKSQKSYTQLEYEFAQSIGLPILAFFVNEEKVRFLPSEIDLDEKAAKLRAFKEQIKSASLTCDFFESPSDLEAKVLQAITGERRRQTKEHTTSDGKSESYIDGAKLFSRFLRRPALFKNKTAILKVRFDGQFGSYLIKDELPRGFGFQPGTALYLNDLFVLGREPDLPLREWQVDCFADGEAAEWIEENDITTGTIFTGRFKLCYESVKGIVSRDSDKDAFIVRLILEKGIEINSKNVRSNPSYDISDNNNQKHVGENEQQRVTTEELVDMLVGLSRQSP